MLHFVLSFPNSSMTIQSTRDLPNPAAPPARTGMSATQVLARFSFSDRCKLLNELVAQLPDTDRPAPPLARQHGSPSPPRTMPRVQAQRIFDIDLAPAPAPSAAVGASLHVDPLPGPAAAPTATLPQMHLPSIQTLRHPSAGPSPPPLPTRRRPANQHTSRLCTIS